MTLFADEIEVPFGPVAFVREQSPVLAAAMRESYPALSSRQRMAAARHRVSVLYKNEMREQAQMSPIRSGADRFLGGMFLFAFGVPTVGLPDPDIFGAYIVTVLGLGSLCSSLNVPGLVVRRAQARAWLQDAPRAVSANRAMRYAFVAAERAVRERCDQIAVRKAVRRNPHQKPKFSHLQNQ